MKEYDPNHNYILDKAGEHILDGIINNDLMNSGAYDPNMSMSRVNKNMKAKGYKIEFVDQFGPVDSLNAIMSAMRNVNLLGGKANEKDIDNAVHEEFIRRGIKTSYRR
jgi:hypothetical protein